jgi:hypothetical protein
MFNYLIVLFYNTQHFLLHIQLLYQGKLKIIKNLSNDSSRLTIFLEKLARKQLLTKRKNETLGEEIIL